MDKFNIPYQLGGLLSLVSTSISYLVLSMKNQWVKRMPYLFLMCFGLPLLLPAQTMDPGKTDWLSIGQSNGATIQIQFRIRPDVCATGRAHRFELRVLEPERIFDSYVVFTIYYLDCESGNTMEYTKSIPTAEFQNSSSVYTNMDYQIPAEAIFFNLIKAEVSSTQKNRVGSVPAFESEMAQGITGPDRPNAGQTIELTVEGGLLGQGATWTWYKNQCEGQIIGTGKTLSVSPTENTTYFVKPSGGVNEVDCISKTLIVNTDPAMAEDIIGPASVCQGQAIQLKIKGGYAPANYEWVWYEKGKVVGRGPFLNIAPSSSTTYSVVLEGAGLREKPITHDIILVNESRQAQSATVSETALCEGKRIKLSVEGGSLAEDAEWVWYWASSTYASKEKIGVGRNLTYSPSKSGYYFVRAEGACNATAYNKTPKVEVTEVSEDPVSLAGPNPAEKDIEFTLSLRGGQLAQDAEWVWLRDGKEIYRGPKTSLEQRINTKTKYEVYGEGSCGKTEDVSLVVDVVKAKRKVQYAYRQGGKGTYRNIMHFQLAIGSFFQFREHKLPEFNGIETLATGGSGFLTRVELHPYMGEYASFGLNSTLIYGLPFFTSVYDESITDENITYRSADIRFELGVGYRNLKLLGIYTRSYHAWDIEYERNAMERHSFTEVRDGINTGIRLFFPFSKTIENRKMLDVTANFYTASSLYPTGNSSVGERLGYLFTDPIDLNPLNVGFEARLWFPSAWTIGVEYLHRPGQPRLLETGPRLMLYSTFQFDVFK